MDIAEAEDRIIYVNTFSKNWAMTGWRMGWLRVHPSLQQTIENLIQYSTSGVAQFMQRGGVAALDQGDSFLASQIERARQARDLVCAILGTASRARINRPQGTFYLFFSIDGVEDSRQAACDIVDEANVGLAPGTAFGVGGEAFFRLCFQRDLHQLEAAATRLASWMRRA
jgi:aspartate/methionine/tyrosine aminotransferase